MYSIKYVMLEQGYLIEGMGTGSSIKLEPVPMFGLAVYFIKPIIL